MGYIYLIWDSKTAPDVFKVGRTSNLKGRIRGGYHKTSKLLYHVEVPNDKDVETQIKHRFCKHFGNPTTGAEYFRGDSAEMVSLIQQIVKDEQILNILLPSAYERLKNNLEQDPRAEIKLILHRLTLPNLFKIARERTEDWLNERRLKCRLTNKMRARTQNSNQLPRYLAAQPLTRDTPDNIMVRLIATDLIVKNALFTQISSDRTKRRYHSFGSDVYILELISFGDILIEEELLHLHLPIRVDHNADSYYFVNHKGTLLGERSGEIFPMIKGAQSYNFEYSWPAPRYLDELRKIHLRFSQHKNLDKPLEPYLITYLS